MTNPEARYFLIPLTIMTAGIMGVQLVSALRGPSPLNTAMAPNGYYDRVDRVLLAHSAQVPLSYDCLSGSMRFEPTRATAMQKQYFWHSYLARDLQTVPQPLWTLFEVKWTDSRHGQPCRPEKISHTAHLPGQMLPGAPTWRGKVVVQDARLDSVGVLRDWSLDWEAEILLNDTNTEWTPVYLGAPYLRQAGRRLVLISREYERDRGAVYVELAGDPRRLQLEIIARPEDRRMVSYSVKVNGLTIPAGGQVIVTPESLISIRNNATGRIHTLIWCPQPTPGRRVVSNVNPVNGIMKRSTQPLIASSTAIVEAAPELAADAIEETLRAGHGAQTGAPGDLRLSFNPGLHDELQRRLTRFVRVIDGIEKPRSANLWPSLERLQSETGRNWSAPRTPIRAGVAVMEVKSGRLLAAASYPTAEEIEPFINGMNRGVAAIADGLKKASAQRRAQQIAARLRDDQPYWTSNNNLSRHRIGSVNKVFLSSAIACTPKEGERDLSSLLDLRIPAHDWTLLNGERRVGTENVEPIIRLGDHRPFEHWVLGRLVSSYPPCGEHMYSSGHEMTFEDAIRASCNHYFATVGHLLQAKWRDGRPEFTTQNGTAFAPQDAVKIGDLRINAPIVPAFGVGDMPGVRLLRVDGIGRAEFMARYERLFNVDQFAEERYPVPESPQVNGSRNAPASFYGFRSAAWDGSLVQALQRPGFPVDPFRWRSLLPESVSIYADFLQLRQHYEPWILGSWENRWTNIKLAEAFSRLVTGVKVCARLADWEENRNEAAPDTLEGEGLPAGRRLRILQATEQVAESGTAAATSHGVLGQLERWKTAAVENQYGYRLYSKTGTVSDSSAYSSIYVIAIVRYPRGRPNEVSDGVAVAISLGGGGNSYVAVRLAEELLEPIVRSRGWRYPAELHHFPE
jgi:hypothetical protein